MSKLKRLIAPKFWPIERKTKKYVISPKPGSHSLAKCLPLGLIIRDILGHAETLREAKIILNNGEVNVDGRIRKKHDFPVGLMDILSIGDEHYRILANKKGLYLKNISENEAKIKMLRIRNKTAVRKGIQLNFHDGTNKILDSKGAGYKTGDTVLFNTENKNIEKVIRFDKGNLGMIVEGKNVGIVGKIRKITVTKSSKPNMVTIDAKEKIVVPKDFVFIIGEEKSLIDVD